MFVRSFGLSDSTSVSRLLQETLSEECYKETMAAFARQLSWDSDTILIAEKEASVIGVIIGTIDNEQGYYYRIAVHPDHAGQGIGQAMIEALKSRFLQRKVKRIWIGVDAHNEPILSLYEKAGYAAEHFTRAISRLGIVAG